MALDGNLDLPGKNPILVESSGLSALIFVYEGIRFEVSAVAENAPNPVELYSVPTKIIFPNGNVISCLNCYDPRKKVFIPQLVEDHDMVSHYPEEYEKLQVEGQSWLEKWDTYRLQMSGIFSVLFENGMIEKTSRKKIG